MQHIKVSIILHGASTRHNSNISNNSNAGKSNAKGTNNNTNTNGSTTTNLNINASTNGKGKGKGEGKGKSTDLHFSDLNLPRGEFKDSNGEVVEVTDIFTISYNTRGVLQANTMAVISSFETYYHADYLAELHAILTDGAAHVYIQQNHPKLVKRFEISEFACSRMEWTRIKDCHVYDLPAGPRGSE